MSILDSDVEITEPEEKILTFDDLHLTGRPKVEYDFLAISNTSFTVPAGALGFPSGDTFTTNNRDLQMLTVGFNYLFNGL